MTCSNCGLANAGGAKFCANCGTPLEPTPSQSNAYVNQPQYGAGIPPNGQTGPYNRSPVGGNSTTKNIALGCLILIAIFMFFGLSCTRACFGRRHYTSIHRRW